jgi:hypothetical protein
MEEQMTDDQRRTQRISGDDAPPALDQGPSHAAAQPPRKRRGVAGGRIAAAGIGIAAMLGLVANMEVAGSHAQAAKSTPPTSSGPEPSMAALRWEKSAFQGPATAPDRLVATTGRKAIVLTPHTIVNTVGGGSSGGSSASYSGGSYAGSYSAPAPAAAPVATTSGSTAH